MKQTWKLITSRGTTWKVIQVGDNNPKKKNSVPSFVSHFVHLMDLRTDHTQVCASTSCAKAAKQTNTIPPRRVYLCRWTSKRPSTSSQPIELYNFPPITRGRINKTRRQMDAVFLRANHTTSWTLSSKDVLRILSKTPSLISHRWRFINVFFPLPFKERRLAWTRAVILK